MASLLSGTTIGGYTAVHSNNISSYALTSVPANVITTSGGTLVGNLSFADAADNIRFQKGSNHLNLKDPWNNFHLAIYTGGIYTDATAYYFRNASSTVLMQIENGDVTASSSMRAPIFYDSNDLGYYLNPNSNSRLNIVRAYRFENNDSVSSDSTFGLYFGNGDGNPYAIYRAPGAWTHPYPDLRIAFHTGIQIGANASYQGVRFYTDYDMSSQVMSVNNGSDPLGGGNVYVNNSLQAGSSLRAPIFYDSNDTNYYVDPNSTSVLNRIVTAGRLEVTYNTDRYQMNFYRASASNWWVTNDSDRLGLHLNNVGDKFYFATDGDFYSTANGWLSTALAGKLSTSGNAASATTASQVSGVAISGAQATALKKTLDPATLPYSCDIYVDGDANTYYPVHFIWGDQDVWRRIIIKRGYGEEAPWDPIGTGVHHGGLLLDWEGNFGGWGGAEYSDRLRVFNESYTNVCADMYIYTHSMGYVFMLRGGHALYHIYSDQEIRGYNQVGTPDIAYNTTSTYFYENSGAPQYNVRPPAPVTSINSSRIDGLRTKKQSLFDNRYLRQGVDISGIGTITATNFLATNAFYLNNYNYYLNSSNGGIYTNARFETAGNLHVSGSSQFNGNVQWFSGRATIGLENQSEFARFAFYGLSLWDWDHGEQMVVDSNYVYVNNYLQAGNSLRAPIFYDSQDTGYYLDPNSTSNLNYLNIGNTREEFPLLRMGYAGRYAIGVSGAYTRISSHNQGSGVQLGYYDGTTFTPRLTVNNDGNVTAESSLRAPIFYDSNNTGYYLDPNSTSNLLTVNVLNTYVGNAIYFGGGNNYFNWEGARINSNVGIQSGSDMRAPIFYDSQDTGYYLDPNGTSNLNQLNTSTRARWGKARWWNDRSSFTSSENYWTGTNGWGTGQGTWANAWKGGFSGWDIWGTGTDHPQGSGYIHAQGIVSGQHYASPDGGDAYGWMMVGAADATANRYWLRGKWGTNTSGWVEMITTGNIGSQSVNYANSAGNSTNLDGRSSSRYLYYRGINAASDFQTYQSSEGVIRFDQINDINSHSNAPGGYTYGGVLSMRGDNFGFQLWGAHTGEFWFKTQWNNDQYSGWKYVVHSGNIGSQSVNYANSAGNASTATTLQTARTLTIGNTGKAFNGGANLSWSISEIGAAPAGIDYTIVVMTDGGNMELTFTKGVLTAVNPV